MGPDGQSTHGLLCPLNRGWTGPMAIMCIPDTQRPGLGVVEAGCAQVSLQVEVTLHRSASLWPDLGLGHMILRRLEEKPFGGYLWGSAEIFSRGGIRSPGLGTWSKQQGKKRRLHWVVPGCWANKRGWKLTPKTSS